MENFIDFVPNKMARGVVVPDFIRNDERLGAEAILIFANLCSYSRHKNYCFPSKETLMLETRCSFNTLQKYLNQLIEFGYVKIKKINGRNMFYLFAPKEEIERIEEQNQIDKQKNLTSNFKELSKFETEVKELNINITPLPPKNSSQTSSNPLTSNVGDFNAFFEIYPNKTNKYRALIICKRLQKKGLLPTLDYFKKVIEYFKNTFQWNKENGRFIPQFANFLLNEKWKEVPLEYFEPKQMDTHVIDEKKATEIWEKEKMIIKKEKNNNIDDDLEVQWNEFKKNFKTDISIRRFQAKAKFFQLIKEGFSFGVIQKNLTITPLEFLQNIKNQAV